MNIRGRAEMSAITMDVLQREDQDFPKSLTEFQEMLPSEAACAAYLERSCWPMGFVCRHCQAAGEPYRFKDKPTVLRCRACRCDRWLTAGTVMARTRQSLNTWFWAAYLLTTNTNGMSAWLFRRQLGLRRYETAFQILHKLRAAMVRPDQDRICPGEGDHVEGDETLIGGRTPW